MKVQITKNSKSATGYAIVTIQDNGEKSIQMIDRTYPNEPFTLVLPENASNRKYFNSKKVEAAGGTIDLEYKASRTLGARTESSPRKGLEEYLEGEEKELFLQLVEKAKKNREEANKKPKLTEIEKKQRLINKYLAEIEALKAQQK